MINNVVLVGRLTKDIDLKYTNNGTAVGTFTLAVNRNFTNQNGDREADFINCVVWRKPAETFANYTKKGSLVAITGKIQTRNYENAQGQRVYVTEVVVENFQFLESSGTKSDNNSQNSHRNNAGGDFNTDTANYGVESSGLNTEQKRGLYDDLSKGATIYDDDLPF